MPPSSHRQIKYKCNCVFPLILGSYPVVIRFGFAKTLASYGWVFEIMLLTVFGRYILILCDGPLAFVRGVRSLIEAGVGHYNGMGLNVLCCRHYSYLSYGMGESGPNSIQSVLKWGKDFKYNIDEVITVSIAVVKQI